MEDTDRLQVLEARDKAIIIIRDITPLKYECRTFYGHIVN